MGRPKKPIDLDAAIAAYLFSMSTQPDRLRSQAKVAEQMGVSEATVSRLLRHAREIGLLRLRYVEQPGLEEAVIRKEIERRGTIDAHAEVIRAFAERHHPGRLKGVHIFEVEPEDDGRAAWEQTLLDLGEAAASLTRDFLLASEVIGVAWGRTLHAAILGAEGLSGQPWRPNGEVKVVPLWGELFTRPPDGEVPSLFTQAMISSTRLAERIAVLMTGDVADALSLAGVPALINRRHWDMGQELVGMIRELADHDLTENQVNRLSRLLLYAINASINDNRYYLDIFGPLCEPSLYRQAYKKADRTRPRPAELPLADALHTALVAIGASDDQPDLFWNPLMARHAGLDMSLLSTVAYGDIGGVLIERPLAERGAVSPEQRQRMADELKLAHILWTGVRGNHLRGCAIRASESDRPGVVVYAAGRVRVKIIRAALEHGLVNHLVLDASLGRALADDVRDARKR